MLQPARASVAALWRYPVKSMQGEDLESVTMTPGGLLGDRAYALIDRADGRAATAKNPRKWPALFAFRASFVESPQPGAAVPRVRITLPDQTAVTSGQDDADRVLSAALHRDVTLTAADPGRTGPVTSEGYWPDMDGLPHRDTVNDFQLPEGTFFDCATVHILTTATLERFHQLYPQGRFEVPRFRPNIVLMTGADESGFVEEAWIGRTLAIGDFARLSIIGRCGRCVMTTLPQRNLPEDSGILRTIATHNEGRLGVYAKVERGGTIRRGDAVTIE